MLLRLLEKACVLSTGISCSFAIIWPLTFCSTLKLVSETDTDDVTRFHARRGLAEFETIMRAFLFPDMETREIKWKVPMNLNE